MIINVRVIPKSSKTKIMSLDKGNLKVHLTAAPDKNKANSQLIKLLSEYFKVPKRKIQIIKGFISNNKIIKIQDEG